MGGWVVREWLQLTKSDLQHEIVLHEHNTGTQYITVLSLQSTKRHKNVKFERTFQTVWLALHKDYNNIGGKWSINIDIRVLKPAITNLRKSNASQSHKTRWRIASFMHHMTSSGHSFKHDTCVRLPRHLAHACVMQRLHSGQYWSPAKQTARVARFLYHFTSLIAILCNKKLQVHKKWLISRTRLYLLVSELTYIMDAIVVSW